jgi:hypothetical protein
VFWSFSEVLDVLRSPDDKEIEAFGTEIERLRAVLVLAAFLKLVPDAEAMDVDDVGDRNNLLVQSIFVKALESAMAQQAVNCIFEGTLRSIAPDVNVDIAIKEAIFTNRDSFEAEEEAIAGILKCSSERSKLTPQNLTELKKLIHELVSRSCEPRNLLEANPSLVIPAAGSRKNDGAQIVENVFKALPDKPSVRRRGQPAAPSKFTAQDESVWEGARLAREAIACTCSGQCGNDTCCQELSMTQHYQMAKLAVCKGRQRSAELFYSRIVANFSNEDLCNPGLCEGEGMIRSLIKEVKDEALKLVDTIQGCENQKKWARAIVESTIQSEIENDGKDKGLREEILYATVSRASESLGADDRLMVPVVGTAHATYVQSMTSGWDPAAQSALPGQRKAGIGSGDRAKGKAAKVFWDCALALVACYFIVVNALMEQAAARGMAKELGKSTAAGSQAKATINKVNKLIDDLATDDLQKREKVSLEAFSAFGLTEEGGKSGERMPTSFETDTIEGPDNLRDIELLQFVAHFILGRHLEDLRGFFNLIKHAKEVLFRQNHSSGGGGGGGVITNDAHAAKDAKELAQWTAQKLLEPVPQISPGDVLRQSLSQWGNLTGGIVQATVGLAIERNEIIFGEYPVKCSKQNLDEACRHIENVLKDTLEAPWSTEHRLAIFRQTTTQHFIGNLAARIMGNEAVQGLFELCRDESGNGGGKLGEGEKLLRNCIEASFKTVGWYGDDDLKEATYLCLGVGVKPHNRTKVVTCRLVSLILKVLNARWLGTVLVKRKADGYADGYVEAELMLDKSGLPEIVGNANENRAFASCVSRLFSASDYRGPDCQASLDRLLYGNVFLARPDLKHFAILDAAAVKLGLNAADLGGWGPLILRVWDSQRNKEDIAADKHVSVPVGHPLGPGQQFQWLPHEPDIRELDPGDFDNANSPFYIVIEAKFISVGAEIIRLPRLILRLQCYNGHFELGLYAGEKIEPSKPICGYGAQLTSGEVVKILDLLGQAGHLKAIKELRGTWYLDGRWCTIWEFVSRLLKHEVAAMCNGSNDSNGLRRPELENVVWGSGLGGEKHTCFVPVRYPEVEGYDGSYMYPLKGAQVEYLYSGVEGVEDGAELLVDLGWKQAGMMQHAAAEFRLSCVDHISSSQMSAARGGARAPDDDDKDDDEDDKMVSSWDGKLECFEGPVFSLSSTTEEITETINGTFFVLARLCTSMVKTFQVALGTAGGLSLKDIAEVLGIEDSITTLLEKNIRPGSRNFVSMRAEIWGKGDPSNVCLCTFPPVGMLHSSLTPENTTQMNLWRWKRA